MRMAIQDKRRLFREGLCILLESQPDLDLVAAVSSIPELLDACDRAEPHAVVFQADGAPADAARIGAALRRRHRRLRIIGVYSSMERHHASEITNAGVDVLVASAGGIDPLLHAVRDGAARTDMTWLAPPRPSDSEPLAPLTDREREVLRMVGTGHTTREIAACLGISAKTVENHKHRIFSKLGVHNQAHAVSIAMRAGILTSGSVVSSSHAAAGQ
jgi:DNA-binding NarL/FixJ family response regulator